MSLGLYLWKASQQRFSNWSRAQLKCILQELQYGTFQFLLYAFWCQSEGAGSHICLKLKRIEEDSFYHGRIHSCKQSFYITEDLHRCSFILKYTTSSRKIKKISYSVKCTIMRVKVNLNQSHNLSGKHVHLRVLVVTGSEKKRTKSGAQARKSPLFFTFDEFCYLVKYSGKF